MSRCSGLVLLAGLLLTATASAEPLRVHPVYSWLRIGDLTPEIAPRRAPETQLKGERGVTILERRTRLLLRRDGIVEESISIARAFYSDEAAAAFGNVSIYARSTLEEVDVLEAATIQPDGRGEPVSPDTIHVVSVAQDNVFSDEYEVVIPLPGLRSGSVGVVEVERRYRAADFPLAWTKHFWTRAIHPIRHFEVVLEWEPGVPEPVWATDDASVNCVRTDERRVRCDAFDLPAFLSDDEMGTIFDLTPQLVVAQKQSWSQLSRQYSAIVEERMTMTAGLREKARLLVAGATGDWERFRRIHRFVADEVRYVGMESGTSAVVPHAAEETLQRRYGDCKDKVTLLLALSRAVGIDAYPVLVSTNLTRLDKLLLPSWSYFNHAIVCTRSLSSIEVCVDLTIPLVPTATLPPSDTGRVALAIRPAESAPRHLDAPKHGWVLDVSAKSVILCDGAEQEENTRSFEGYWAGAIRLAQATKNTAERESTFKDEFAELFGSDVVPDIEIDGLKDPSGPVSVRVKATFGPGNGLKEGPFAIPDLWLRHYAGLFATNNRHHRYQVDGLRYRSTASYSVCDQFRIGFAGPSIDLEGPFGNVSRRYEAKGDLLVVRTEVTIPRTEIAVDRVSDFNRFLDDIAAQTRVSFTIAEIE